MRESFRRDLSGMRALRKRRKPASYCVIANISPNVSAVGQRVTYDGGEPGGIQFDVDATAFKFSISEVIADRNDILLSDGCSIGVAPLLSDISCPRLDCLEGYYFYRSVPPAYTATANTDRRQIELELSSDRILTLRINNSEPITCKYRSGAALPDDGYLPTLLFNSPSPYAIDVEFIDCDKSGEEKDF